MLEGAVEGAAQGPRAAPRKCVSQVWRRRPRVCNLFLSVQARAEKGRSLVGWSGREGGGNAKGKGGRRQGWRRRKGTRTGGR